MTVENQNDSPENLEINAEDKIQVHLEVSKPKLLKYASFAREWFENASKEAQETQNPQAVRREIVFAACMVESYLYEWVRDEVLDEKDPDKIQLYFDFPSELDPSTSGRKPGIRELWKKVIDCLCRKEKIPRKQLGITKRWKKVIDRLHGIGKISGKPDWGESKSWNDFTKLVKLRDEVVHAGASRPETSYQSESERSFPTIQDLEDTPNGWATRTVVNLIRELHEKISTSPPTWLSDP